MSIQKKTFWIFGGILRYIEGSSGRDGVLGLAGMELTFPKAALLVLCRSIGSWKGVGNNT